MNKGSPIVLVSKKKWALIQSEYTFESTSQVKPEKHLTMWLTATVSPTVVPWVVLAIWWLWLNISWWSLCMWGGRFWPLSTFPPRVVGAHLWHTPCPGALPGLHAFLPPHHSLFPSSVFACPSPLCGCSCLVSSRLYFPLTILSVSLFPNSKFFSCSVLLPISFRRCTWAWSYVKRYIQHTITDFCATFVLFHESN